MWVLISPATSPVLQWNLSFDAVLGNARGWHAGAAAELGYCLPLGQKEESCLSIGPGIRVTAGEGPYGHMRASGKIYSPSFERQVTPYIHFGLLHYPRENVGLGLVGRMGYSAISGEGDNIQLSPSSSSTSSYSESGLFYSAALFFKLNFTPSIGMHASLGVDKFSDPTTPQIGPKEKASYLEGTLSSVGMAGSGGLHLNF